MFLEKTSWACLFLFFLLLKQKNWKKEEDSYEPYVFSRALFICFCAFYIVYPFALHCLQAKICIQIRDISWIFFNEGTEGIWIISMSKKRNFLGTFSICLRTILCKVPIISPFFPAFKGKKLVFDAGAPQCTCTFCGVNVDKTNLRCLKNIFLRTVPSAFRKKRDRVVRLGSVAPWGGIWNICLGAAHGNCALLFVLGCLSHHLVHPCSLSLPFFNNSSFVPLKAQAGALQLPLH